MLRSRALGLATSLFLALTFASASAQSTKTPSAGKAPPRRERAVPFKVGETLTYDVSWAGAITAATATVNVREKSASAGSTSYVIVAEGQPIPLLTKFYSFYYRAETLLDVYTLLPRRSSIQSHEGERKRMKITTFDQSSRTATFESQSTPPVKRILQLPGPALDALSALQVVRTITLKAGGTTAMTVVENGTVFRVNVSVGQSETVRSELGTGNAWKLTPVVADADGRATGNYKLAMWITDDARRLPVKLEVDIGFGAIVFSLRNAT